MVIIYGVKNGLKMKKHKIILDDFRDNFDVYWILHDPIFFDEDWIIVEGSGVIIFGDEIKQCVVGDRFHIESKKIHRASANSEGLVFIEVQRGVCDEEDIVRIEDNYGRVS